MADTKEPVTVWSTEVDHCPDVVSWFPSPFHDTFLCGKYELIEASNKRVGGIAVYKLEGDVCRLQQNISSLGVLDVRWISKDDCLYLASALSDGNLALFSLDNSDGTLKEEKTFQASNKSSIVMSLDSSELEPGMVATCDTTGFLSVQNVFENDSNNVKQWKAHEFEIWAVAFDKHDLNRMFSGGDDCSLKCWDFRTDLTKASFQSEQHSMGITSISVSTKTENHLYTGSYDECIKHWDCRNMKKCVKEVNVGGGVWRLRWNPNEDTLSAACMHNGAKILNNDFSLIASYSQHQSMVYGIDSNFKNDTADTLMVSCSFYDKALHLWKLINEGSD